MRKRSGVVIGIDPGLFGAVCVLDGNKILLLADTPIVKVTSGPKVKRKHKNKYVPEQMAALLEPYIQKPYIEKGDDVIVAIELVSAMPGQGVTSMFNMGYGCGLWRGIAAGLGMAVESVSPVKWKHAMLGKGAGQDKNASILRACTLFPKAAAMLDRKKDHGRAEALLLAAYVRDHL